MNRYRFLAIVVLVLAAGAFLSPRGNALCSEAPGETQGEARDGIALAREAEALLENGDYARALARAEQAILESERRGMEDIRIQALFVKAKTIGRQGYLLDSLKILEDVLAWRKERADPSARVETYVELARSAADSDLDEAESYLSEAEKDVAAMGDEEQRKRSRARLLAGRVYPKSLARDLAGVIDCAEKAAALYRELGDSVKEADSLLSGASAFLHRGEYDAYLETLEKAEKLYTREKHYSGVGKAVLARGMMHSMLGEYSKAEEAFQQSLRLQKQAGNKALEVRAHSLVGNLRHGAAEHGKARDSWEKGLALAREIGDIGSEIWLQSALADLQAGGDPAGAASLYRDLVAPAARTGNKGLQADVLYGLGDLFLKQGLYRDALDYLNQAMSAAASARRERKAAMIRSSLITLYSAIGDYEKALDQANLYVRDLTDAAIPWLLPNAFALRAGIHERLSMDDKALEDYREGIALAEKNQDRLTAANLSQNAALIHGRAGRNEEALRLLAEAEQAIDAVGSNEELLSSVFLHMGETLAAMGRFDDAVQCYTEALALSEKMDRADRKADIMYILGNSSLLAGHAYTAVQFHERALAYYEDNRLWRDASKTHEAIAGDYEALGKKEEAFQALGRGIDAFERARSGAGLAEFKTALQGRFSSLYDAMIYECLSRRDVARALEYVEREKSRSLLDMLGNTKVRAKGEPMAPLVDEEMALRSEIQELQKQKNTEKLREAYRRHEMLVQRIKAGDPSHASLITVGTLSAPEIQSLLDPDTAILEYHIMGRPSARTKKREGIWNLNIFVVTREAVSAARVIGLPDLKIPRAEEGEGIETFYVPQDRLDGLVAGAAELHEILGGANPWQSRRLEGVLQEMTKTIFSPVIGKLSGKKHLCIIPHGILHHIPFSALVTEEGYLCERYRLSFAPSASVLRFALENDAKAGKAEVILADTETLHFAEREVAALRRIHPEAAVVNVNEAGREKVEHLQGPFRFIHFATHGVFSEDAPLFSYLRMGAEKDRLEVREIFNLDLPSSLVTLSGCETGRSSLASGEDLVGLGSAFLHAGAASLAVSLWKVDDRSTAIFMEHFYSNLKTNSRAEALRQAQLRLIKDKEHGHPFYWAPFILMGDWK